MASKKTAQRRIGRRLWRFLKRLFSLFLIVIIAAGGGYYLQKKSQNRTNTELEDRIAELEALAGLNLAAQIPPTPKPTPERYAVFNHADYGFTLEYPADWQIVRDQIQAPGQLATVRDSLEVGNDIYKLHLWVNAGNFGLSLASETYTLEVRQGKVVVTSRSRDPLAGNGMVAMKRFYNYKTDYIMVYNYNPEDREGSLAVLDRILGSMRFEKFAGQ